MTTVYQFQLNLHYGLHFPADQMNVITGILKREDAEVANGSIDAEDSKILFSFDSDRKPVYGIIFVQSLAIGTPVCEDATGLSIDFGLNDLENLLLSYPKAVAKIAALYDKIIPAIDPAIREKIRIGWRAHVCEWHTLNVQKTETRSTSVRAKEPSEKASSVPRTTFVQSRKQKTKHIIFGK